MVFKSKGRQMIGYSDTLWYGGDHFGICHHLEGMHAVIRYRPAVSKDYAGDWLSIELRDASTASCESAAGSSAFNPRSRTTPGRINLDRRSAVSPILKYSNWLVSLILFVVGARVFLVISRVLFLSHEVSIRSATISLIQIIIATLFLLAAYGTFRWEPWGRSLAIPLCVWNAFATIFLTRLGPHYRIAGLTFCAVLLLMAIWFYLPKVKVGFIVANGPLRRTE
jgi:hypothetical protein